MKMALFVSSICAGLLLSSSTAAQGSGLYLEGGLGVRANTTKIIDADPTFRLSRDVGERSLLGSLRAGWRWSAPESEFGINAFWNPARKNAGRETLLLPGIGSVTERLSQEEHFGIGAEAGWRITPPTTLYARLDYHSAKFQLRSAEDGIGIRQRKRHDGWGYGIGLRHSLDDNSYVFAEWQQVEFGHRRYFDRVSRVEPRNTMGMVGAGWRF